MFAAAAGCRTPAAPTYPTWVPPEPTTVGSGKQATYLRAAEAAVEAAPEAATRVFFTPDRRKAVVRATAGAVGLVQQAVGQSGEWIHTPHAPFTSRSEQAGWRLIGRALVWRIEDALDRKDDAGAVGLAIVATQFGADLCSGDATDASLGFAIMADARRAVAPHLTRFQSSDLQRLSQGVRRALERMAPPAQTLQNERTNMLAAVQAVQDAYRDNRLDDVGRKLLRDAAPAVERLQAMRSSDGDERVRYFEGMAGEADALVRHAMLCAGLPTQARPKPPKFERERPWSALAKPFFSTWEPLLAVQDEGLARTRLFALECALLAQVKRERQAPDSLKAFEPPLTLDPYTGEPFVYRSDGGVFRIYSVGADYRDDGGDTDEAFSQPDLKLERRAGD